MASDSSDILGQQTMPILKGDRTSTSPFSVFRSLVILVVLVVIYVVGNRLRRSILLWREESYKLATRRRHGIPDSDLRPFNVAYSEAMTRARDEEKRRHAASSQFRPQPTLRQRDGRSEDNSQTSQRFIRSETTSRSTAVPLPGSYYTPTPDTRPQPTAGRSNPNLASNNALHRPAAAHSTINGISKPLYRQPAYTQVLVSRSEHDLRKRSLDENEDEHEMKKTRVDEEELVDSDSKPFRQNRGSKRGVQEEDEEEEYSDEFLGSKKARGKRARKLSLNNRLYSTDQDMDIDDEEADEVSELRPSLRGKKRDRAEAGSTFGGDDEESEPEVDTSKARRRHRKRRTVAKRKSEVTYARGKKREREGELDNSDLASEDDSAPEKSSSRKRRGRRSSHKDDEDRLSRSDISMDDSTVSTRSKIRNIGDEWESNGVKYKIGPNGQRLRQALVKKARHKFVMPKDSQHPDRDANLQVCIECWLTEEEYRDAKAQHLLAWQDSPKKAEETEKLTVDVSQEKVRPPQGTSGKSLLWSTSTSTTPTLSPSSYSPAALLPTSPFLNSQVPTVRRISTTSRTISLSSSYNASPKLTDSTNGPLHPNHKVFSKWEKQELEAQAMMKIRELNRKKEQEKKEEKEKAEKQEQELRAKLEERSKVPAVPSISIVPPEPPKPAANPSAAASGDSSIPKLFAPPPASTGSTTSTAQGTTASSNIFGKPPQPPAASSTPSQPTGLSLPTAASATATTTNGSTAQAPKPAFSFPAPVTSSTPAQDTTSKPTSSFSFAPASSAPKVSSAPASEPQKSMFSFPTSAPAQTDATAASKTAFSFPTSTPTGTNSSIPQKDGPGSIFSRIAPAQPANTDAKSTASTAAPTPPPLFSFAKTTPAAPPSIFSSAPSVAGGSSTPAADKPSDDKKPLFSFPSSTSTPSNPFGSSAKTSSSTTPATTFSFTGSAFGGTQTPNTTNKDGEKPATSTTSSTPASVFGSNTGAFGSGNPPATSVFGNSTQANGEKPAAPTSAFGSTAFGSTGSAFGSTAPTFGASNGTTGSVFGNASTVKSTDAPKLTTPSTFPSATTGSSVFGSASNIFGAKPSSATSASDSSNPFGNAGASSSKPAETPKPIFSFNANALAPATNGTSTTTPGSQPAFSFAPSAASTTPAPSTGGFSFKFAPSTTPAASPFGAAGASGFGQPSTGTTNGTTTFSFGAQKQA
ncbi:hypothetical protein CVT24_012803 [Panaeolus cyanescens]|uniref:Uncharacterized protein n=1 Tax=Panaeolus cyanescens TaxID=181874 RepID=A0A409W2P7_9AGAR|nr:hypothetical protein CVT24_012803 [Panaeolus cyanescens]